MSVAVFVRKPVFGKIFCDSRASAYCQQTACFTYSCFLNRRRNFKIFVSQIAVDPFHDRVPDPQMPGAHAGHGLVLVISSPYTCCIIRSKSAEPAVGIIICRSGLAGRRHMVKSCRSTGTSVHNIFHRACEKISCGIFYCLMSFRFTVIDQHIPVMIEDLSVQDRIRVGSLICDRRKSGSNVYIADTVCDTAERQRLVHIILNNRCDVEVVLYIFITFGRSDNFGKCLYGACVDGLFDRIADGCPSDIPVV